MIIWDNSPKSYEAVSQIKEGFSFKSEFIQLADLKDIKLEDYFIIIAVWIFSQEVIQNIFEEISKLINVHS